MLLPFLVALQFLTRFPVRLPAISDQRVLGRSLLYYPLVGLFLGLVLAGVNSALADAPASLRAALMIAAWVLLTGALHLDGLADSADAWIGGIGNRKRTLAIMKDPYCGPAAVVTLVVVILIKFAALQNLDASDWLLLALIPMLGRTSVPLLFFTTEYVRPGGIGSVLASRISRTGTAIVVTIAVIATVWIGRSSALWLLLAIGITFALLRAMMVERIGGTTGDTAGALIELSEAAMLVTLALLSGTATV